MVRGCGKAAQFHRNPSRSFMTLAVSFMYKTQAREPLIRDAEVLAALRSGAAVVALESTVISHGLPHPINIETARAMEAAIRAQGAVPAAIAVLDGRLRLGLDGEDLERLAQPGAVKVSRRDLPWALTMGGVGGATVSATMIAAAMAGISVFATGGIGGVHRGGHVSLDISADLEELAQTPVAVVCAGAKAILDLPRTLEYLETRGVPVIGYGCDHFPGFYVADTGLPVDVRCDDPMQVARILRCKQDLDLGGGTLVATPIPDDVALDPVLTEQAIAAALAEAEAQGVRGKHVTPFLLGRLEALTGGASLKANQALLLNNATLAAKIAVAYRSLENETSLPRRPLSGKRPPGY
jgi:pseudouridylate synthase